MKIVHVLAPAHAGGLERVVHALAIGHHRRGHHVVTIPIVEAWTPDHSFAVPLARANVEVRPLIVPARAYRRERAALGEILRELAPDVMHSHGSHTDVVSVGVARGEGVATVSTAHGFTRGGWRNLFYEYLDRMSLRRFDAVAAVSRPIADELLRTGVSRDRLHVIPNAWGQVAPPIDRASARRELGLDPEQFVVGWVGRMSREKGLDILVDSLPALSDLPIRICLIGAGPERAAQEARAVAMGVASQTLWAGLVQEAGRFFQAFDVLVLSSRTEGVPMVVLEAMATGIPIVASAVGGIPDVVSGREAILVPAEQPDALASAVRSVFENPAQAAERAAAARARLAQEFAEEPWLKRYEMVYERACAARQNKGSSRV